MCTCARPILRRGDVCDRNRTSNVDQLPEQAAREVRSGGRENLPSERAPIDGRDVSLKIPQSGSTSSSSSPLPSTPAAGQRRGFGGSGSGSDGVDLQVCTGNKDDGGTDDAHERGKLRPGAPPEEAQGAALEREGANNGVALGSEECSRATQADGPKQEKAPKVTGGKIENTDRRGGSGEGEDAEEDDAKGGSKGEKGPARTGGGTMRVVEVTDLFRTMKGLKCALGEAYTCCFGRTEEVRTVLL